MRDSSCLYVSIGSNMMNSPCIPMPSLSLLPSTPAQIPNYDAASDWHCSQLQIKQERSEHLMDHDSSATSGVGSNSGASPGGCSSASSEGSPSGGGQVPPAPASLASPTPASAPSPRSGSTLSYDPIQSLQGLAPESARRSPTSPPTPADENSRSSEGSYEEGENQTEQMDTTSSDNQNSAGGNLLRCHLCEFTDLSREVMSEHIASHYDNQEPGLSPDEADDGDYDEASLSTPKFNAQGKVKTFRCKNCGHLTVTKVAFWAHHRTHIKDDRVLQCPRCPFVTEYKHHLEYHLRNHFNSKPYKCDKCPYACVNKSMLNSHLKSHSNVYQYHCQDCVYATKYCHSLKLHLRKYGHRPAMVLNPDGSPNPLPIIDVYGTRRGPKNKSGPTVPGQTPPGNANSPGQPSPMPLTPQPTPSQIGQPQMFPFGLGISPMGYQTPSAVRRCPYCEFYCADGEQLAKHMFLHTDPGVIQFLQANNNNNNNPEGLKEYLASLMWQQSSMSRTPQIQAQRAPHLSQPALTGTTPAPTVQPTAPAMTQAPPQAPIKVAPPTATPPPARSPPVSSSPTAAAAPPTSPATSTVTPSLAPKVRLSAPLDLSMPENSMAEDAEDSGSTPMVPLGKNRRKGRAFKLERIAMLLQQQSGEDTEVPSSQPSPPSSPQSPAAPVGPVIPAPSQTTASSPAQEAYNCTYCDITFKDVVMYTMHMGYHGYQDPFLCNMCGQQTTDKVSFFLHVARSSHS